MKLIKLCFHLFLILAIGMVSSAYTKKQSDNKISHILENKNHLMGDKLEARYLPLKTPVVGLFANHTYPIAFYENDKNISWGALGRKDGGKILSDTTTDCGNRGKCIDISTVNYIMSEEPCIWPYENYYGVVGVCWNATNRGLFFTDKTVHNVKFYTIIETWFGTYGLDEGSTCISKRCQEGRKKYSWTKCLESVEKNMPWEIRGISDKSKGIPIKINPNPRIELYKKHIAQYNDKNISNITKSHTNIKKIDYLSELLKINIEEKLGENFDEDMKKQLLDIHKKHQQIRKLGSITKSKSNNDMDHEEYLQDLNRMINNQLDDYKKILSDQEYKKLFGATKNEKFNIKIY